MLYMIQLTINIFGIEKFSYLVVLAVNGLTNPSNVIGSTMIAPLEYKRFSARKSTVSEQQCLQAFNLIRQEGITSKI